MPRFIGPGCITIACSGSIGHARGVEAVAPAVLARVGEERGVHALALHPQHHDDVGLRAARRRDRRSTAHGQPSTPTGSSVGGATSVTSAPSVRKQQHVRARHPAVQHVADDRDPAAVETAEVAAHRERVEQRLRRVLVRAVAGVDHAARRSSCAQPVRRAAGPCRIDEPSAPIASSVSAVSFRLSPLDTLEPLAEKLIDVGRQPLGGGLERRPGAGRVLEEEVHHRPAAQRRHLLDRAGRPGAASSLGGVEDQHARRRGSGRRPRAGVGHARTSARAVASAGSRAATASRAVDLVDAAP